MAPTAGQLPGNCQATATAAAPRWHAALQRCSAVKATAVEPRRGDGCHAFRHDNYPACALPAARPSRAPAACPLASSAHLHERQRSVPGPPSTEAYPEPRARVTEWPCDPRRRPLSDGAPEAMAVVTMRPWLCGVAVRMTARPLAHEGIRVTAAGAMPRRGERRRRRHSLALVGRIESVYEGSDDELCARRLRGLPPKVVAVGPRGPVYRERGRASALRPAKDSKIIAVTRQLN